VYLKLLEGVQHILVNRVPTGKLKEFLLNKYSGKLMFIKKVKTRKLGSVHDNYSSINYRNLLSLSMELDPVTQKTDKSKFRGRISEYQFVKNTFTALFKDETNCEESPEFLKYVVEQKEIAKLNRKRGIYSSKSSNYVRINKQEGDITIQLAMQKEIGSGCKFVKKAVKITDLNKLHKSIKLYIFIFLKNKKKELQNFIIY